MSPSTSLDTGARLIAALERTGPHPVLAWYGEAARIELSGHVLANWVIKAIGHLDGELALTAGDEVALDLPPHWKRLVLALAAWSLGAGSRTSGRHAVGEDVSGADTATADPLVVATDRPDSQLAADVDEVLAIDPVSLAPRFSGELPPMAHDWAAEVRAFPDQLSVPLPSWAGPHPEGRSDEAGDAATAPRVLVAGDGLGVMPAVLAAWLAGGGIVGPSESVSVRQAEEEGVTGSA